MSQPSLASYPTPEYEAAIKHDQFFANIIRENNEAQKKSHQDKQKLKGKQVQIQLPHNKPTVTEPTTSPIQK